MPRVNLVALLSRAAMRDSRTSNGNPDSERSNFNVVEIVLPYNSAERFGDLSLFYPDLVCAHVPLQVAPVSNIFYFCNRELRCM